VPEITCPGAPTFTALVSGPIVGSVAALGWVIAAFVMAVLEVFSLDLVFGTLVLGALSGALTAALGGDFRIQAVVASVVSLVLLAVVRPLVVKRLNWQGRFHPTGTAAHVGRPARVVVEVTELGGRVKLAGEEWSARSEQPGDVFPVGTPVVVVAIDGATAVVGPDPSRTTPSHVSPEEPRP
jgi:membrane protein implicated in regulation of membrane protease activity